MIVRSVKTKVFKKGENLFEFIKENIKQIPEKSIVVITSKIVALSEGRFVDVLSKKEKEKLIKAESDYAVKTKWVWLTVRDGSFMASAGIDESNADGGLVLLPKNSFKSAEDILKKIKKHYRVKKVGVLITDSRTNPLRLGVVGMAVGCAGFEPIKSYVGKKDIFNKKFNFSKVNIADCLASSAVVGMGEGNERKPLAMITDLEGMEIKFISKKIAKNKLAIKLKDDIYKPILKGL